MALDFSKIDISAPESLQTVQTESKRAIENDLTDEASKLWHTLVNILPATTNQDLARGYQIIVQDLSWVLLPILTEAQRFALFRGSLLRAIQIGIELESALTRLVYTIPPMIWLEVAPQYLQALRENTEPLGPKTLGAWFSDFQRSMPDQKPTDLDVLRYLGQDPEAKELTEAERTLLIKAFQYYIGLTPLSLAEVDKYVTPEERDAFMGELEQLPDASILTPSQSPLTAQTIAPSPMPSQSNQQPASPIVGGIVGGSTSNNWVGAAETEVEQPTTAPIPVLPRAGENPSISRPDFPPLPQSPSSPTRFAPGSPDKTVPVWSDFPESDSPLDRTPIARPRRGEESRIKKLENQRFYSGSPSPETVGRSQELRDQNESVVNLRQPPRPPMPQPTPPPMPRSQPAAPQLPRQSYQTPRPAPVQPAAPSAPIPPRELPRASQPSLTPQYAPSQPLRQPPSPMQAPRPSPPPSPSPARSPAASPNQNIKAAPPPNLPVAKRTHNEGQEIMPYKPEQDPFMPHKPKPVPKLAGNIIDLK